MQFPLKTYFVLSLMAAAGTCWGIGIAMRFVDVTLENVEPGASVNLRVARNLPLVVINQDSENATDIVIESVATTAKELKDGYEPIPDPSWIRAIPNRFHLGPKASASSDILIEVPNDPKLVGRHFEAIVWVHTEQKNRALTQGGVVFQTGLRSRFRMSIGTLGPASLQREKSLKKLATINTNFNVSPETVFALDVPVGQKMDLKTLKKASLKVINQSDDPVSLKIRPVPPDPNILPQSGYENVPDPTWLTLTPQKLNVKGNAIQEVKLVLNIPDKPEFRGKKYMFLVQTTLADETLPLIYFTTIYISTLP